MLFCRTSAAAVSRANRWRQLATLILAEQQTRQEKCSLDEVSAVLETSVQTVSDLSLSLSPIPVQSSILASPVPRPTLAVAAKPPQGLSPKSFKAAEYRSFCDPLPPLPPATDPIPSTSPERIDQIGSLSEQQDTEMLEIIC